MPKHLKETVFVARDDDQAYEIADIAERNKLRVWC